MGKNRVFFPQAALDQWISEGKVDLRRRRAHHQGRGTSLPHPRGGARRARSHRPARCQRAGGQGEDASVPERARGGAARRLRWCSATTPTTSCPGFWAPPSASFEEHMAGRACRSPTSIPDVRASRSTSGERRRSAGEVSARESLTCCLELVFYVTVAAYAVASALFFATWRAPRPRSVGRQRRSRSRWLRCSTPRTCAWRASWPTCARSNRSTSSRRSPR